MDELPSQLVLGPLPHLRFAGISLPTYFVYMSVLLSGLAYFVYWRAERRKVNTNTAMDLFLICLASGAIGARLFHILWEEPAYYIENPLRLFYFWQGGFVYFAGLLTGMLAGYLAMRKRKQSFLFWADFLTPVLSVAYALGRVACFLEGCCYGRACDLPWAYGFGQIDLATEQYSVVYRHPTQLYAMAVELLIFGLILLLEKKKHFKQVGSLFMFWLLLHGLSRMIIEMYRADDRGFTFLGLSISTMVGIGLVSVSLAYFTSLKRRKV